MPKKPKAKYVFVVDSKYPGMLPYYFHSKRSDAADHRDRLNRKMKIRAYRIKHVPLSKVPKIYSAHPKVVKRAERAARLR